MWLDYKFVLKGLGVDFNDEICWYINLYRYEVNLIYGGWFILIVVNLFFDVLKWCYVWYEIIL